MLKTDIHLAVLKTEIYFKQDRRIGYNSPLAHKENTMMCPHCQPLSMLRFMGTLWIKIDCSIWQYDYGAQNPILGGKNWQQKPLPLALRRAPDL